jgi:branched-subunit amino acid ABC-type transport system permease component
MRLTRIGQFMVGVADNPGLAELYGINKRQIFLVTMLISGAFVGLGMFLYGSRAQVLPQTGLSLMLFAVVATIIGGIGNVAGAAIAALILGIIQNASILFISSEWQGFLLYIFLFLAIVFFPNGLRLPKRRIRFGTATRDLPPGGKPSRAEGQA